MLELLAPAGDFECAKIALYNGADAIYLASFMFGARAYAKNLSLDELDKIITLAHSINKKIYVTVNTILKENEYDECIKYVNKLYEMGVDGLILADFGLIDYVINNLPKIEAHISTQCGVKDLSDTLFFQNLGAKRVVIARECSIEEIKYIKDNSNIELEVFGHGALCVCYSGGCLLSSLLSLRSGNRGRCSQNCRREYSLYKDNQILAKDKDLLSMKDLNSYDNLNKFIDNKIDSIKLEGRMKNPDYVKLVTSSYRNKMDDLKYQTNDLERVFHRKYTKGFLFGEDSRNIADTDKKNREGEFVGTIVKYGKDLTEINTIKTININDRLRIESKNNDDYYFTIDKLYDKNKKSVTSASGYCYITLYKTIESAKIYRMIDSSIDLTISNKYKAPLIFDVYGSIGKPLVIKTKYLGKTYSVSSSIMLDYAKSNPLNDEMLFKQLSKLNDTSFYLKSINNYINEDLFITVSAINELRRNLIVEIESSLKGNREIVIYQENINRINYDFEDITLTAFCTNIEQYNTLKELGIKYIYFNNYIPYVNAKYNDISENYILAGNYGAIYNYKNKEIISDYSFNVINSKAVYALHKHNVKYVTLSLEASLNDIKNIYNGYKKYGDNPNLEIIVYGKQNLMTTKYCPLKAYNQCGECNKHKYLLKDEKAYFEIYHTGCITHIINSKPLNLIDDLNEIIKYSKRLRLSFTNEDSSTIIDVVSKFREKLNNPSENKKYFDSNNNTRGYYKREIL